MLKKIEAEVLKVYGVARNGTKDEITADSNAVKAGAAAAGKSAATPVAKAPAIAAATKK